MSKHARARSRTRSRQSRSQSQSRPRTSRRVALAATVGLLTFTAGWLYALDEQPGAGAAAPQARSDGRPAAAPDRAARGTERDPLQGLTGISEQTRAKIPADARQLILVTGKAADSSESTAALYTRPAPGADWVRSASWPARNGAKGWSTERTYGDLTSPQGVFALTDAGGRLSAPPGTRLPYDKDGAFVATGRGVNGESLAGSFDYVVAIDFNRRPGRSPWTPPSRRARRRAATSGSTWTTTAPPRAAWASRRRR